MYKEVLLLYHIESRDKAIFETMAYLIKKNEIAENIYVRNMEDVYAHPYDYAPDVVISPLPRNNRGSAMFTLLKMVYQCYWIGYTVETFYDMVETNRWIVGDARCPKELIDKYLFCGPGIAAFAGDMLVSNNRTDSLERVDYFGYLYYEKSVIKMINERFKDKTGIFRDCDKYKKRILFVTAIMKYPMSTEDYLEESALKNSQTELAQELHKLCVANNYYSDKYVEVICHMASRHPDYMIMVKMHPNDIEDNLHEGKSRYQAFEDYPNVYIIPGEVQISNYFDVADIFIHYASTTSMEAYIYGLKSIGLTSNHPCMQRNGLGREALYANTVLEVENIEEIEREIMEGKGFERNKEIEEVLYSLVNYKYDSEYEPSRRFIEIIRSLDEPQRVRRSKKEVKEKLLYRSNLKKYLEYPLEAFKSLIRGDVSRFRRITRMVNKLLFAM